MAGSVNKVIIIGNLGKDPECRTMTSGDRIVNMTVATSESWKDKQTGERKEKTEWHRVCIFNDGLAGIAEKYLRKGSKVYLEGALQTRKWTDKSGGDQYTTEIVLQKFRGELTLLDGAKADGGEREDTRTRGGGGAARESFGEPSRSSFSDDMDDSIPFLTRGVR